MNYISKEDAIKQDKIKYYDEKPCRNGHIDFKYIKNNECLQCKRDRDAIYRQNNRKILTEKENARYYRKREEILEKDKLRYQENREEKLKYANEYRNENKDKINRRDREYRKQDHVMARRRERDAYLRKHCPKTITMNKCRELLHRTLKVINEDKTDSTYTLLGYKPADLREHVEKYMIDGMTWENFGEYWCLDHRNPVSQLVQLGITEPSVINCLDNLRPLLVAHNLSKWSKTEEEYFGDNPDIRDMYPYMINPLA